MKSAVIIILWIAIIIEKKRTPPPLVLLNFSFECHFLSNGILLKSTILTGILTPYFHGHFMSA